jgi:hypothetical protein
MGPERLRDEGSRSDDVTEGSSTAMKMVIYGAVVASVGTLLGSVQPAAFAVASVAALVFFAGLIGVAVNGR